MVPGGAAERAGQDQAPARGPCREAGGSPGGERQCRYIGHGAGCVPPRRRGRAGSSSRAARGGRQRHRPLFLALTPGGTWGKSPRPPRAALLGMLSAAPAPALIPGGDGDCCRGCRDPCPPASPSRSRGDRLAGVPSPPRGMLRGWSRCRWRLPGPSFLHHPLSLGHAELLRTPLCPQDLAGLREGLIHGSPCPSPDPAPSAPAAQPAPGGPWPGLSLPWGHRWLAVCPSIPTPGRTWTPCLRTTSVS